MSGVTMYILTETSPKASSAVGLSVCPLGALLGDIGGVVPVLRS